MVKILERKSKRITVFLTPQMDEKLDNLSELMGMDKQEVIRYCIGDMCLRYEKATSVIEKQLTDEFAILQGEKKKNKK